ncbi:hypothetical protein ACOMHN_029804 [Nucella lapillus]
MSLYNALGDSHQQGNLSWNHSAGFSQTSGAFTNCTPVREQQPLGSSVQPQSQILSSLLSAPSSCNQNGLLLDEPGMVIGREEVILTDNNPVASSGYPTSAIQNQQILPSHIHSAYNHTTGHGQFLQGSVGSSTPQEFVTHPSQSIGSYGQDSYSSASHLQGLQRNQPVYVVQQQGVNQESPGGPLQQNQILGQQQGGASQQALSMQQLSHLQGQPQSQAQLSAVSQLPQHNQTGQQQQTGMPHPLGQLHGQVMGMDQQQQQQTAYPQQQQQQANNMKQGQPRMLFLVQPSSVSGNPYVTSHHSSQHLPAQQLPQNAIQTAMGSPLASSLPNSPQLNPQVPSKGAMNSSPQMSVQKSPQLSLQSSPQMSVQSSPQPLSLQGSPSTSQNSGQMAMMPSTQSKQQLSGQDASQLGNLSQLNNTSQAPTPQQAVQNVSQVVQLQNANHLPKTTHLPYTPQPSGSVMPQQSFQVYQQVPVNQQGINQFLGQKQDAPVRGSGRGRGRGRGQSKGSRGGRGRGRGRGNANHSTTGLHMAPDHFRPDMGFPVPLETPASDMEPAVSHAESSMQSQEASMQELSMPVVKSEPNNGSLLQGSNVPCLASYSTPIQQTFATKEVWPTPMPPPKQEQCDSPPALIVNTTPQSSHQPNISPALSPTSFLEDIKVSPPATPVPVVSAAEAVSPPAQAPAQAQAQAPGQLAAPVAPESAEEKPKPMPVKRQLPNDGEGRAVCKYCGYCSTNLETCEGCSRAFPPDTKVILVKKQETAEADNEREQRTCGGGKVNSTPAIAGPSASKKALYGNKLQAPEAGLATNTSYAAPNNLAGKTPTRGSYTRQRGSGARRGSYRRKLKEPVTLTISSDDDDDPSSDTSRMSVSTITTPAASQDEEDGFFSPTTSGSKPNSFGMSRRFRMQDASGQIVRPTEGLFFDARGVRVGTMRTTGIDVRFRAQRIVFKVISDTTKRELEFFIFVTDLTWIKFCFSQPQPVFFLRVNAECGQRLRTQLKMSLDSVETFDPSSQDDKKNMVVVIVDKKVTDETGMREILKLYNKVQNVASFLQEVDSDTCNELLVKSSPGSLEQVATIGYSRIKVLQLYPGQTVSDRGDQGGELGQNEENSPASMSGDMSDANENRNSQDGSDTPSPTSGFIGPEEKYLFLEKLSEADRARTHIFSSFFFKRLTLRSSPGSIDPQEKLMTPAQRRHNRVRTWTRHVDLFEKDFIFIPINEKAHWMMAVVCFPGLMAQQQYNYQAASPAITEEVGQSGDAPPPVNTQGGTEDEASQDSQPDSTTSSTKSKANSALGRVVSADEAKEKKGIVNVGLKQACILIMDSLSGPNRTNIVRHLKDYLQVEWGLKKTPQRDMLKTIRGCQPKVPQQSNYSDCGLFVLQYVESFFENPIANFSIPMKLGDWFPRNRVDRKREEIRNLILRLQAEYNR